MRIMRVKCWSHKFVPDKFLTLHVALQYLAYQNLFLVSTLICWTYTPLMYVRVWMYKYSMNVSFDALT